MAMFRFCYCGALYSDSNDHYFLATQKVSVDEFEKSGDASFSYDSSDGAGTIHFILCVDELVL